MIYLLQFIFQNRISEFGLYKITILLIWSYKIGHFNLVPQTFLSNQNDPFKKYR